MGQNVYSISSERWKQEMRNAEYKSNLLKAKKDPKETSKKSKKHHKRTYKNLGVESVERLAEFYRTGRVCLTEKQLRLVNAYNEKKAEENCLKFGAQLGFPRDLVRESIKLNGTKTTMSRMRSYQREKQKSKVAGL